MNCGLALSAILDLIFRVFGILLTFYMLWTQASSCSRNLNVSCSSEASAFLCISHQDPKSSIQKYWTPLQTLLHKWTISKKTLWSCCGQFSNTLCNHSFPAILIIICYIPSSFCKKWRSFGCLQSLTINSESLVQNGTAISHKYVRDCATEEHYTVYIRRG